MLTPKERLEQLEKVLQQLDDLNHDVPIIVEGARDTDALRKLGIEKRVKPLNTGKSVFSFCEDVSRNSTEAIILTDWDRRGGRLARMLKEGLQANGVRPNLELRAQIVILSKKEIKDIESLPTFIDRLKASAAGQRY
jgi:5S rRNA maturation endonuclease (ribonuclease M5)